MKIAVVQDWLPFMGGSERVLSNILELYPDAPVYTTIANPDKLDEPIKSANIITSFLQKKNKPVKNHRMLLPFMPTAIESFDLNEYDVVISSSSSVAKAAITAPNTLHICYCHTPMRYAWDFSSQAAGMLGKHKILAKYLKYFMTWMRVWDYSSAARVDDYIANSKYVARRIKKYYGRDSVVINPPVRCRLFEVSDEVEDFYLCASRLQEYKRFDLAIEACNRTGAKLKIIGDGPDRERLEKMAGPTIEFLGRAPDDVLKESYAKCKAYLFPGEEDFGITPLEAQASGRPVIAYGRGGALETVVDGKTGLFFNEQTPEALIDAMQRFEEMSFDPQVIRRHAEEFDESVFKEKLKAYVDERIVAFFGHSLDAQEAQ